MTKLLCVLICSSILVNHLNADTLQTIQSLPLTRLIPGKFGPSTLIRVRGLFENPDFIHINFQYSSKKWTENAEDNVPLHVSLNPVDKDIGINAWDRGRYGTEDKFKCASLKPGEEFELVVIPGKTQYTIVVNGNCVGSFKNRISYDGVRFLHAYPAGLIYSIDYI